MMKDLIIIGGGPAGLTAAIYAMRCGLGAAVIERFFFGGQAATTADIENYPGLPGISGPELAGKFEAHARHFGTEIINAEVVEVDFGGDVKTVRTVADYYEAKAIIIATGAKPRRLEVPGEDIYMGRGVSYCATCDGAFFRNKKVAVVGGGNTAIEDALYLAGLCEKVYLIHRRDEFRADLSLVKRLDKFGNIETVMNSTVKEIVGGDTVSGIVLKPAGEDEQATSVIDVDGVFVAIGAVPNIELFADKLEMEDGYIVTDVRMETSAPGVFAAGDIRVTPLRQIITACADGAIAAGSALDYIRKSM